MEKGNFCTYSKVPMVRLSKETMIFKYLSSAFLSSLILIYGLKFLSCGKLAFTHNGAHLVKPIKFDD